MDGKFSSSNLQIYRKLSSNKPKSYLLSTCILKCRSQSKQESTTTSTLTQYQAGGPYSIKFQTLQACKLGISMYPDFEYNAQGGVGTATGRKDSATSEEQMSVSFDTKSMYIPALTGATTRFLGLPLPPFLKIDVVPEVFRGTIDSKSGKVELGFRARFWFSIGTLYRAPPLVVETTLTSEESTGTTRKGKGKRMDGQGNCRLVGVATVDPVNDIFLDTFLRLPAECIADLNARISINSID